MSRLFLTKLHLLLAAFLFPAILMFLVTGGLYTWGVTGKTGDVKREVSLSSPLKPDDEAALRGLALAELKTAGLDAPSGKSRVRKAGDSFTYEWTGSRRDVTVEVAGTSPMATVTIKEASLHRTFVQLHKAKGGVLFKLYASLLALSLFLLVGSGLIIGWQSPPLRRMTTIGSLVGLAAFAGIVAVS